MKEKHPKDRLREIAQRVEAVFSAGSREAVVVALREVDRRALQDLAWFLVRERGLRERLRQALRHIKALEDGNEKTGMRSPIAPKPKKLEDEERELREVSQSVILEAAVEDAFEVDDEDDWFVETQD